MKKLLISVFVVLPMQVIGQTNSENYIQSISYQKEYTEAQVAAGNIPNDDKIETITYYDGLGRPKQTVTLRAGGDREDLIIPVEYDHMGRQPKNYLPLPVSGNEGGFYVPTSGTIQDELISFYKTKFPDDFYPGSGSYPAGWDNPYSNKRFEASPASRLLEQGAPGKDWHIEVASDTDHTVKFEYHTNTANEVIYFSVDLSGSDPDLDSNGFYAANQLTKNVTKDENWVTADGVYGTSMEYTNKQGQMILKRISVYDSARAPDYYYHDTYYVYDDYGNLTFVLSPEGSEQIVDSSANLVTGYGTILDDLCYRYKYDYRNRLVEKKIPGKGKEYILYDALDRPILTQDANLRIGNDWLFTKYDDYGRVAYTGLFTNSGGKSMSQIESDLKAPTYVSEDRTGTAISIGGTTVYYTNFAYPTADLEVYTINYYDDYDVNMNNLSLPASVYGETVSNDTQGLPTVSWVKVLDTSDWILSFAGYDNRGRTIYTRSQNDYLDTDDILYMQLDFAGKLVKSNTTHKKDDLPILYVYDYFSYDHMGRLISHTQKLDNEPVQLIAENSYDDLGQLTRKYVGGETYIDGYTEITNADMTFDGELVKNTTTNAWDAGAKTKGEILEDGGVSYVISTDDRITQVGLVKTSNSGGWNSYDFGIYHSDQDTDSDNLKDVKLIKNGVLQSTVVAGYEEGVAFSIERVGTQIIFKKGGSQIGTAAIDTSGDTMIGKASLYHSTAQIEDFTLFGTILDKKLQDVDYTYNVRGWLTDINDVEGGGHGLDTDLFKFRINYNRLEGNASGDELYNGNIAQTLWKSVTDATDMKIRSYAYEYDDLNRVKTATGYKGSTLAAMTANNKHDVSGIDYDRNGNIQSLNRRGYDDNGSTHGEWDDLRYTYTSNSNQLKKVDDAAGSGATLKALGFNDGNTTGDDYEYDDNGNMTKDKNKGINTAITYNHLNFPKVILIDHGNDTGKIEYVYDATGVKLKKTFTEIIGGTPPAVVTEYAGSYKYTDGELQFFNHPEGYVKPVIEIERVKGSTNGVTTYSAFKYVFQYVDHLGNVRLSYADDNLDGAITPSSEIIEESNYYPFGLKHNGYNTNVTGIGNALAQQWKYNGIELNEDLSLNLYEMDLRQYDPAIARWIAIDPVTHHSQSTYTAFDNNPVFWPDPSGASTGFGAAGGFVSGRIMEEGVTYTEIDVGPLEGVGNISNGSIEINGGQSHTESTAESGNSECPDCDNKRLLMDFIQSAAIADGERQAEDLINKANNSTSELSFYDNQASISAPEVPIVGSDRLLFTSGNKNLRKYFSGGILDLNEYIFNLNYELMLEDGSIKTFNASAVIFIKPDTKDMNIASMSYPISGVGFDDQNIIRFFNNKGNRIAEIRFKNKQHLDQFSKKYFRTPKRKRRNEVISEYNKSKN